MAVDKATTVLKTMMNSLQGWADTMNGVGAKAEMTAEEMRVAQVKLQGASDAYDKALENQVIALKNLEIAQQAVADGQQAALQYEEEAAAARQEAATASAADAADLLEYAKAAELAAAKTAEAVKVSVDEQVAAYDKLLAAEALVAKRSQQVADAQVAAGEETAAATTASLGKVGPIMMAAGAAAAYLTVKSVKLAADFQTSMTRLVTSAGESKAALGMVSDGVLKLSDQTGFSATELAQALYWVNSAGYHAADSLKILAAAAKGAKDEQADAATVTNALTTMMKNYGMSASQATLGMNQIIAAVSLGKTNLQEFASALVNILPLAAANGVSFAQVAAALAAMTAKGMTAQRAADDLAFSMRAMIKPNGVAITELGQLGLTATQVQKSLGAGPNGLMNTFMMLSNAVMQHMGPAGTLLLSTFNQSRDIAAKAKAMFDTMPPSLQKLAAELENGSLSAHQWALAIRNLSSPDQKMMQQFATMYDNSKAFSTLVASRATPATQTYATAMSNLMGGAAGLNTALMLVSGQGAKDYAKTVEAMNAVTGRANKEVDGWSVVQGTFNQKMSEAKQTLINTGIAIGQVLLPYVTKLLDAIMKILMPIGEWITAHRKLVGIILTILGPLGMFMGIFITLTKVVGLAKAAVLALDDAFMGMLADPIVLAIAAIAVAAYLIVTHWSTVKKWLGEFWNWLKGIFSEGWNFVKSHINMVAAAVAVLGGPIGMIIALAMEIVSHWSTVKRWLAEFWDWLKSAASATGNFFKRIWNDVIGWFKGIWRDISAPILKEWNRISNDLSQIWSELVTLWNDTGGKLVSFISSNWDTISSITSTVWRNIFDPIKQTFSIIVASIKLYLSMVATTMRATWDFIKGLTKTSWDVTWGIIKAVWDLIWGTIKGTLDIIWGIIKAAWDGIEAIFKAAWDTITAVINTALDFIKDILKVFIDLVTGKWGQMWNDLKKTAMDVLNNMMSFTSSILNDIAGFFSRAAHDIGSGFIGGIEAIGGGFWNALVGLWNTLIGFFKDAANWLWQTGIDLVQGLINGIEHWASHLWDSLQGLANGILGKIGKYLGLGSPSRYTHQYGVYLVEGLVNGINASAQKAAGAARSLAKGVLDGARGTLGTVTLNAGGIGSTGGLFAGGASSAGRSPVNFTVDLRGANIAGPQSIKWVTDQLNKEFVQKVIPTAGIITRRTGG